jgi:hypothetical protein
MCTVNSVSLGSTSRLSHLATLPMWLLACQCFCKEYGFLEDALLIVFEGVAALMECRGRCGLSV